MRWNDEGSPSRGEAPLDELVAWWEAATPNALAVSDPSGCLTYGELGARANRLAWRLRATGIGEESRVAICLDRSADLIVAILGVLRSGAAYVPLDPAYPEARRRDMVVLSGASAVITDPDRRGSWTGGSALVTLDRASDFASESPRRRAGPPRLRDPDRLAYVIFTSGSTGRPKGVAMSHRGAVHIASWCRARYGWRASDRGTQVSGPGFDAAVIEIWPALISGASLHVPAAETRLAPDAFLIWLARERITMAWSPTAIAEGILSEPEPSGLALRYLQTGGDRLRRSPAPGATFRLANQYGPAENAVITTEREVEPSAVPSGALPPIGRPVEGVRVELLDFALLPVPDGETGEIAVSGRGLARGYLGDPAQTAERFVPDPFSGDPGGRMYRTGDQARRLPDGDLEFLGRIDTQVKIRGQRIELGEIEAALAALPFIREAAVLLRDGEPTSSGASGEPRLVACVAVESCASEGGDREVLEPLRRTLPEAMVPRTVLRFERLPLTPNGKVDRRALEVIAASAARRPSTFPVRSSVPPKTKMETRLAAIWAEVFDLESVSVRDSFLDLGGHSLLAVRLVGRIRAEIGRPLSLATLLGDSTIEALAARLEREGDPEGVRAPADLVAIERAEGSFRPPLFFVHAVGGGVLSYVALARALGPEQPFWGLMAPSAADLPEATVGDLAARYVAAVRSVRPRGPYFLGGWSMGGTIAFEMARRIEELGGEVAFVALLDVSAPLADGPEADDGTVAAWFARELATLSGRDWRLDPAVLRNLAPEAEAAKLLALGRAEGIFAENLTSCLDGGDLAPLLAILRRNYRALVAFEPRPWHGPTVLFAAEKGYGKAGAAAWRALAPAAEVIEVGGDHHSLLAAPHVQDLARRLARRMAGRFDRNPAGPRSPTRSAAESPYQQSGQTDSQAEMQSVSEITHQGGQESHD